MNLRCVLRRRWVFLVACILLCGCSGSELDDLEDNELCQSKCSQDAVGKSLDLYCDQHCKSTQCLNGCSSWKKAFKSSCQHVCISEGLSSRGSAGNWNCVVGCNLAVENRVARLKATLSGITPSLVHGSVQHDSVAVHWSELQVTDVTVKLQYRRKDVDGVWIYYRPKTNISSSQLTVHDLHPYIIYQFRVVWILSSDREPLTGPASRPIRTLAHGPPRSVPRQLTAVALDPRHVTVTWQPPELPGGFILSYFVTLDSGTKNVSTEVRGHVTSYIFSGAVPDWNYTVLISSYNRDGVGPYSRVRVRTPPEQVTDEVDPLLIISAGDAIFKIGINIVASPQLIYKPKPGQLVVGAALEVSRAELLVATSDGLIQQMGVLSESHPLDITPSGLTGSPHDLTLDWLARCLYILVDAPARWTIQRLCLNETRATTIDLILSSRPSHIEVDPLNGYFYYSLWVDASDAGLFRANLTDFSNVSRLAAASDDLTFRTFHINYSNFSVLAPGRRSDTIYSLSMADWRLDNVRSNAIGPIYSDMHTLTEYGNILYWANKKHVFMESYDSNRDRFYTNQFLFAHATRPVVTLHLLHASNQPPAVARNPPQKLQALLDSARALVRWEKPLVSPLAGPGAWNSWSYQLHVTAEGQEAAALTLEVNATDHVVSNLQPDTLYNFKVRAVSPAGSGIWSQPFAGRTLNVLPDGTAPVLLWSTDAGLLESDSVGNDPRVLINLASLTTEDGRRPVHVLDVAWLDDQLFLSTSDWRLRVYNVSSGQLSELPGRVRAAAVAVDWLGRQLLWTDPVQLTIFVAPISSTSSGIEGRPLPVAASAHSLRVDSVNGVLYWSTRFTVEMSYLTGRQSSVLYRTGIYSGKQVVGLTVDVAGERVYWMVRGFDGFTLFNRGLLTSLEDGDDTTAVLNEPQSIALHQRQIRGPLHFFRDRLLWVAGDNSAVVSDRSLQYLASIDTSNFSELHTLAVVDPRLQPAPSSETQYLPVAVAASSIRLLSTSAELASAALLDGELDEQWDIVWHSDPGTVRVEYIVLVNNITFRVRQPRVSFNLPSTAFLAININIRAVTRWGESPVTTKTLRTPEARPSAPTKLRVFAQRDWTPSETEVWSARVRWDAPAFPRGDVYMYQLKVRKMDDRKALIYNGLVTANIPEIVIEPLYPDHLYLIEMWSGNNAGFSTTPSRLEFRPRAGGVLQQLLVQDGGRLQLVDLDTHRVDLLFEGHVVDASVNTVNRVVYLLTTHNDIIVRNLDSDGERSLVTSLRGTGTSLAYDWISGELYWSESSALSRISAIYKLRVRDFNGSHGPRASRDKQLVLSHSGVIQKIRVDPLQGRLLWGVDGVLDTALFMTSTNGNDTIQTLFPRNQKESPKCSCPYRWRDGELLGLQSQHKLAMLHGGRVVLTDTSKCHCDVIYTLPNTSGQVAVSSGAVFWALNDTNSSVVLHRATSSHQLAPNVVYRGSSVDGLWPVDSTQQPTPEQLCLLPAAGVSAAVSNVATGGATLQLSPGTLPHSCGNVSVSTSWYSVHYVIGSGPKACSGQRLASCSNLTYTPSTIEMSWLKPSTNYTVLVSVENWYSKMMKTPVVMSQPVVFTTAATAPSAARDVSATPSTPGSVLVGWLPVLDAGGGDAVWYRVHWSTAGVSGSLRAAADGSSQLDEAHKKQRLSFQLVGLNSNTSYDVWITSHTDLSVDSGRSASVSTTTYPNPANIIMERANTSAILITWKQPLDKSVNSSQVEFRHAIGSNDTWRSCVPVADHDELIRASYNYVKLYCWALRLDARAEYTFRLVTTYSSGHLYTWPSDNRFSFLTAGGRPDAPVPPEVRLLHGSVYQVLWSVPRTNGAAVDLYRLQMIVDGVRGKRETADVTWQLVYNGSEPSWMVSELDFSLDYVFRVAAHNEYGWGRYSAPSATYRMNSLALTAAPSSSGVVAGSVVSVIVLMIIAVIGFLYVRRRPREKETAVVGTDEPLAQPDVELAQLRDIPSHLVRQNNTLYTVGAPSADQIAGLPRVQRDHITLTKFLGRGAFGEVYEGFAQQLPGHEQLEDSYRVAIKTLAKGAKEEDKLEFLKEAQLMSNFKHEHIVSLLGVCLDNDPYFLLLELMEGGDLLSYLRANRGTQSDGSPVLGLSDQLRMCLDVARGCQYLEQMHFVHRDLAARNCLVTTKHPGTPLLVKIGDFGLARDIYKSDYYRKEGEGLLPVRWMSPESLIDGVFTSQSDVWAFGILLWEVVTKGQQPYPARTNLDVLHFVRGGGILDRPQHCPLQMYDLMRRCWEYRADGRISFQQCLATLQDIELAALAGASMTVHNAHYATLSGSPSFNNTAYSHEDEITVTGAARRVSSSASYHDNAELLEPADCADAVFGDDSAAISGHVVNSYLQLRQNSEDESGYEVPTGLALPCSHHQQEQQQQGRMTSPASASYQNLEQPGSSTSSLQEVRFSFSSSVSDPVLRCSAALSG